MASPVLPHRAIACLVLLPLILITVAFTTRHFDHPAALDILTHSPRWHMMSTAIHKRHPQDDDGDDTSSSSSGAETPTATLPATAQPLPTAPTNPTIPTPFPQPFDSTLTQNFSSASCYNFFTNMTSSRSFRACRPFSLLLQSSNAFLNAQNNLTLLNNLVWGTCHSSPGKDQCVSNMAWFANSLQTECTRDLQDSNAQAVDTLLGLQAFDVMYDAGCLEDPTTDSYCFVNAVHSPSPADLYYYQLALGINSPNRTLPSCSACTRSVLKIFSSALDGDTQGRYAHGLGETYEAAAEAAIQACGADYAATEASSAVVNISLGVPAVVGALAYTVLFLWNML